MPDTSSSLGLPYLLPAQAQKHVTHNEALQLLDLVVQLRLRSFEATTPPTVPDPGAAHALGSGATGDWAGKDGQIAVYSGDSWLFVPPREGWLATHPDTGTLHVWRAGSWQLAQANTQNLSGIGINSGWDTTNRLAVACEATLFSHAGAGHQMKLNKATSGDTASLLYQAGWSGRAEMGLAGSDDFAIKVSADGAAWTTALAFDAGTGLASGAAVQASADDTTPGRLARADYAYGPGNLLGPVSQVGGLPTGAVIEQGSNANGHYLRYADGTQICHKAFVAPTHDIAVDFGGMYASDANLISGQASFAAAFSAIPSCFYTCTTVGASSNCITGGPATTTRFANSLYATRGSVFNNAQVSVSAMAIGRWF